MASRPNQVEPRPQPRLYLLTPQLAETAAFAAPLKAALAAADVAAVLLRLQQADERTLINRAKALAPVVQGAGAALLLDGHADLVARAGVDGVHLMGLTDFTEALERLKPDRIVGIGGLTSRHDCMLVAEQGADYVMFGLPDAADRRPPFEVIEERVTWWAELFELPCVAYADNFEEISDLVAAGADFIALGDWLWRDESAIAATLQMVAAHLRLPEAIAR
jgi:thiamine-phosphate pyrophosphorylase